MPAPGIDVTKVLATDSDPVAALLDHLEQNPTDLVVLATHQRERRARWFSTAVAEPLARGSGLLTLFLPAGGEGFVSRSDGSVSLRRIATALQRDDVAFTALHVGDPSAMPAVSFEPREGWSWRTLTIEGDVVQTILAVASECAADLIVMATRGHHGFLDALRGSTTERVLRQARCPVRAAPVGV